MSDFSAYPRICSSDNEHLQLLSLHLARLTFHPANKVIIDILTLSFASPFSTSAFSLPDWYLAKKLKLGLTPTVYKIRFIQLLMLLTIFLPPVQRRESHRPPPPELSKSNLTSGQVDRRMMRVKIWYCQRRQSTSSRYEIKHLYLGFWYTVFVNSTNISTNIETAMLSISKSKRTDRQMVRFELFSCTR